MLQNDFRAELITGPAALFALREEWDQLYSRSDRPYLSQGYEWCRAVWEMMAQPQGQALRCVIVRNAGRVVLIWPFTRVRHKRFWTALVPLAGPGDYDNVLVEASPRCADVVTLAWRFLCGNCGTDLIKFNHVRSDSLLFKILSADEARPLFGDPSPCLLWDGHRDWDSYWRSISKSVRGDVDRCLRRFREQGEVSFELITSGDRYRQAVDWMLRHKKDWFARKGHTSSSWLGLTAYERLLASAADRISRHGQIVIFALLLDGQLMAVQVICVDQHRMLFLHPAHDNNYAKLRPGYVLMKFVLRWAFDRALSYDFLYGVQSYKLTFSTALAQVAVFNVARSRWGRVHEGLRAFAHAIKSSKHLESMQQVRRRLSTKEN